MAVCAQTLNGLEIRLDRRFPVHRYAGHDFVPGIIDTAPAFNTDLIARMSHQMDEPSLDL